MEVLKRILIITIIFLILIYLCLFMAIPYFLNKKDYSKLLTQQIRKETGLILIIHKYKLAVSPSLAINLKAEDVQLFYPDKKQVMNIRNADVNISAVYLLFKEIKLNKAKADELQFSTKLLKNGKTTFQQYLETNIQSNNDSGEFKFSQTLPVIDIKNYLIKIKDEESGQKFKITGKDFRIKQDINLHYVDLITRGNFYCFDNKYASYDIKLSIPKVLFKDVNKQLFDITADNLYKYRFYADIKADLKIIEQNQKFDSLSGKIDIDNFSIKLGEKKLPGSYFHITADKGKASLNSKFYTDVNESADINAQIKIKKPYEIDMDFKCKKADINNLQKLSLSVLEILKVKNNLADFKASGTLAADFKLKTDLKTLKSNGIFKIINGNVSHKSIPLKITNIDALVDFSNNEVNIKKSTAKVNEQPVNLKGTIDKNAVGDLTLSAQNLDLNHIMNAFPFLKPQKNMIISTGKLSLTAKLKGPLNNVEPEIFSKITDFSCKEKINQIKISIKEIIVNARTNRKDYSGQVEIKSFICTHKDIPNLSNTIKAEKVTAVFDKENLIINPAKINLGNARATLRGNVKDYLKNPQINLEAGGTADTSLIKLLIPKNNKINLSARGYLPVKILIKNTKKETDLNVEILANPQNYITPLRITNFSKTNTLTNIKAKIENNSLIIKDASIYYAPGINSLMEKAEKSEISKLKKAVTLKGRVDNINKKTQDLNNLHIQIPEPLSLSLPNLADSKATFSADILLNGNIQKPEISGYLNLSDLSAPSYKIKARSANINFAKNNITAQLNDLKIKNMDISIETLLPVDFFVTNHISHLKLSSNYIDLDTLMELMPLMTQASYSPGIEFPYIIKSSKLYIRTCKIGNLKAENISADISSHKNVLYLKNMFSDTYGGKTAGRITYNFPYTSVKAELQGRNLDAASAAKAVMPKEQQMSGRLNFDADVSMFGTNTIQQMKTMTGRADVLIKNGHLGQLGRFEHFLYAQNLLSQRLIYANLNSAKQAISPKDTGYITYLKGMIKFNSGYARLNPVLTAGPQMSMYITGSINMLNNEADLEILGRISSEVSSSMGLLGKITIKEFLDEHTKYGQTIANLFNSYNTELPEMDISKIPDLSPNYRYETKNFRVLISGDTESVKAVKSFTWINPSGTKRRVLKEKALTQPKPVIESRPAPISKDKAQETNLDFLDTIPDSFKD